MHLYNLVFHGIPIILGKLEHFDTMNSLAGEELLRSKCCLKHALIITYVQCIIVAVPKTLFLHAHNFFSPLDFKTSILEAKISSCCALLMPHKGLEL